MPPQILIQDVEQFQELHNLGGDIGEIKRSLHCLRKQGLCEDNTLRNEATWLLALWQTQLWLHQIHF